MLLKVVFVLAACDSLAPRAPEFASLCAIVCFPVIASYHGKIQKSMDFGRSAITCISSAKDCIFNIIAQF
jgi:hypothetical protein